MDGPNRISPRELFERLGTASPPLVFDVRRAAGFPADSRMLIAAERGAPDKIAEWALQIPTGRHVVVYCIYGHEVSQDAARALGEAGIEARYLAGGITGWAKLGLPLRTKTDPPAAQAERAA